MTQGFIHNSFKGYDIFSLLLVSFYAYDTPMP